MKIPTHILLNSMILVSLNACGPRTDTSVVNDFSVGATSKESISVEELASQFPGIMDLLKNPEKARQANSYKGVLLGAGSAAPSKVNTQMAEGYTATWGETTMKNCQDGFCRSDSRFGLAEEEVAPETSIPVESTEQMTEEKTSANVQNTAAAGPNWGVSAPGTLNIGTQVAAAATLIGMQLGTINLDKDLAASQQARSRVFQTKHNISIVSDVKATFDGQSKDAPTAVAVTLDTTNSSTGGESLLTYYFLPDGTLLGFFQSSSAVWNGQAIPAKNGPSAAAVFL